MIGDALGLRSTGPSGGSCCAPEDLLRPGGEAGRGRADRHRDRPGRTALPASRRTSSRRSWRGTRPPPTSPGCRRSRPTWARGRPWRWRCPASPGPGRCGPSRCRPVPPWRRIRRQRTRPSTAAWSSAAAGRPGRARQDVLHRPGHRGARAAAGGRRGHAWAGWPSACASSSTSPRSSKPPVDRLASWLARLRRRRRLTHGSTPPGRMPRSSVPVRSGTARLVRGRQDSPGNLAQLLQARHTGPIAVPLVTTYLTFG